MQRLYDNLDHGQDDHATKEDHEQEAHATKEVYRVKTVWKDPQAVVSS